MTEWSGKAESRKDKDLSKQFDTLDTNKDGKLDQAEFAVFEDGFDQQTKKSPRASSRPTA